MSIQWRVIRDDPLSGARNMAIDHALALSHRAREGVLRLYTWATPTVSFGRNEPTAQYDRAMGNNKGIEFVRRPTGGRAVLHHMEATYCVVLPDRAFGGPRGIYKKVNEGLAVGLEELGAPVTVAAGGAALSPDAGPCFQVPAPGEVMAGQQKLVGSAQVRLGSAVLQHGSIILAGDQSMLAELGGEVEDSSPPATLFSLVGELDGDDLAEALQRGLQATLGGSWEEGEYRSGEVADADWLEKDRYTSDEWTWSK